MAVHIILCICVSVMIIFKQMADFPEPMCENNATEPHVDEFQYCSYTSLKVRKTLRVFLINIQSW
jgi:hypothetical protein